ncbi:hypothetical protein KSF78_0001873 [Schistosoma japonicum]|nr:hypothetical protein KSF78_0001873 [Schistosoma japonicum]
MYIESSGGYSKRWGGRNHTATSYYTDTTGNQWSSASLKNKTRKTLVNQPQSVPQLSPITYLSQQQQQLDFRSLNGSLPLTNHSSLKHAASFACSGQRQNLMIGGGEWTNNLQEKSISEIHTVQTSPDLLYMPHLSTGTTLNSNNNTITTTTTITGVDSTYNNNYSSINTMCCYNEPKESNSLSKEIAYKIKEKFDQRVLRHLSKSKQKTTSNNYTYTSQYHLLAVFLVNKGHVEAWYAYAPMPNTFNNNNEFGHTRLLELTQRRLRLLQRYYSNSRQYVVLYVNNNNSEHYLPMGLVNDTNKQHKQFSFSLSKELFSDRDGSICRFVNSLLPNTMKFVNTNNNNNRKTSLINKQVNGGNSKDNNEKLLNKTDDKQQLYSQQQKRKQEEEQQQQEQSKHKKKKESITSQTTTMKLNMPTSTCINNSYIGADNNNCLIMNKQKQDIANWPSSLRSVSYQRFKLVTESIREAESPGISLAIASSTLVECNGKFCCLTNDAAADGDKFEEADICCSETRNPKLLTTMVETKCNIQLMPVKKQLIQSIQKWEMCIATDKQTDNYLNVETPSKVNKNARAVLLKNSNIHNMQLLRNNAVCNTYTTTTKCAKQYITSIWSCHLGSELANSLVAANAALRTSTPSTEQKCNNIFIDFISLAFFSRFKLDLASTTCSVSSSSSSCPPSASNISSSSSLLSFLSPISCFTFLSALFGFKPSELFLSSLDI